MRNCPRCNEPDGQLLGSAVTKVSDTEYGQTDVLHCTRCGHEWEFDHPFRIPLARSESDLFLPVDV